MNKKGFTLFELLIIVLILSLIGGTGIIIFVNTLKTSETNQYNLMKSQIVEASKVYVETNKEKLSELNTKGYINVKIGDLQEAGFIDWNLINPITNENIPSGYYVNVVKNPDSTLIYNYNEQNLAPVGRPTDPPVLTLNGDSEMYICSGVYNEPGARASSFSEGDISYKIEITGNVNATVSGTYTITYSVTDNSGLTSIATRTVIVSYNPPTIVLNGPSSVTVTNGTYTDPGASANSCPDGDITSKIVVSGTVNLPQHGTYTRVYTITDSTGQSASVSRTINATDTTAPTVTFGTNGNSTYAKSRSTTVSVGDPTAPNATYSGVNTASLKYLWSTSATAPAESAFSSTFSNGGTITKSDGTGDYYLWILAKDNVGNTTITKSNVFKLDNTAPPTPSIARSPGSWTTGNVTLTPSCGADSHSGIQYCCYWNGSSCISTSYSGQATGNKTFAAVDKAGNVTTTTASVSSRTEYRYIDRYMTFNGSNSYLQSATPGIYGLALYVDDANLPFEFEAGFVLNSKSANFYFFDTATSNAKTRLALWYRSSDSTVRGYAKYDGSVDFDQGFSYNFTLGQYYTIKMSGGTTGSRPYNVYVNGSLIGTLPSAFRFADVTQHTFIGRRYTTVDYLNGRIYYFRFQARKAETGNVNYSYRSKNLSGTVSSINAFENSNAAYRFNGYNVSIGGTWTDWSTTNPADNNYYRYEETRTTYY